MTTKEQLYNTLSSAKTKKLISISEQIKQIKENAKDIVWAEFMSNEQYKSIILAVNSIFYNLDKLSSEDLQKFNFSTGVKMLTNFHNYTYASFEKDVMDRLIKYHKPTQDKIAPLKKLTQSVIEEYDKLNMFVKTHKAIESEKFLISLGFEIEQKVKNELEIVKIDKNLL